MKECYDFYTSAARVRGVDGKDSQCLWCGNSDRIVCCNACPHSFCHDCILRHCGHAEYSRINGRGKSVMLVNNCLIFGVLTQCISKSKKSKRLLTVNVKNSVKFE